MGELKKCPQGTFAPLLQGKTSAETCAGLPKPPWEWGVVPVLNYAGAGFETYILPFELYE